MAISVHSNDDASAVLSRLADTEPIQIWLTPEQMFFTEGLIDRYLRDVPARETPTWAAVEEMFYEIKDEFAWAVARDN